ncbi:hypothetical protein [Rheinheimera sp.]|uniref:CsbD family protein n=1 Tax=Rheinheimera sp. TaxID=1869214 RepID=UPI0027B88A5F|nr:hypothetical protein [Rheinheimera sp.]
MNKFSEQNKATASTQDKKNINKATTNNTDSDKIAQAVAADKAKLAAGTSKSDNPKNTDMAKKDPFNGKWKSQIQAAKHNWSKITESELLKSEGNEVSLTELVQQRYALSRDVANQQVQSFITKCHC